MRAGTDSLFGKLGGLLPTDSLTASNRLPNVYIGEAPILSLNGSGVMGFWFSVYEVLYSVWPWTLFSLIVTSGFCVAREFSAYENWVGENIKNRAFLSTIGATLAFLVATTLGTLMNRNKALVGSYSNVCGACVTLALYCRGLTNVSHPTISLLIQSVIFVVKYEYRSYETVQSGKLPLASDAALLARYRASTARGLSPFEAALLLLSEAFTAKGEAGVLDTRDLDIIYREVGAITQNESDLGGTVSYALPQTYGVLQNILFVLFFTLEVALNQVPSNGWYSLLTMPLFASAYTALLRLAGRYKNPFDLSSESPGQASFISDTARGAAKTVRVSLEGGEPVSMGAIRYF